MKQITSGTLLLSFLFGCVSISEPTPQPSASIEVSKSDRLFINEYYPQMPNLKIEGKEYKINEAWVEHPHLERNEGRIPCKKSYDFVMTFDPYQCPNDTIDFSNYTKDLATNNLKIWFFLDSNDHLKDTLILHYREKLEKLNIKVFPTYVLLDKNDRIIDFDIDANQLEAFLK